jgi:hypothetical protein
MYRNVRRTIEILGFAVALGLYALIVPFLTWELPGAGKLILAGAFYVILSELYRSLLGRADSALRDRIFLRGETRLIVDFADRLRFCFTINDLIATLREKIEFAGDGTVLLVDMPKRYLIYNSPSIIGTDPDIFSELVRRYDSFKDGSFFFDDKLDLISDHRKARGFFLIRGALHCYIFSIVSFRFR